MKRYLLILMTIFFTLSCKKVESIKIDASAIGFVNLINTKGFSVDDKKNVTVTIAGSDDSTKTDEFGKFAFNELTSGTNYSFNYAKDGYGRVTSPSYTFLGDQEPGIVKTVNLYQIPDFHIASDTVWYDLSNEHLCINVDVAEVTELSFNAYVKDSPDVSETNYSFSSNGLRQMPWQYNNIRYSILINSGYYKPGTKIYIALYFYNYYEPGVYDPVKKISVFASGQKAALLQLTL